jgi:molecular chaperone DnaK (HSP70)
LETRGSEVTLVSVECGVFEISSRAGDKHLTVDDFDEPLINYMVDLFKNNNGLDITKDTQAMEILKCEVKKAVGSHVNSPFGTSAHNLLYPFATPSFLAS